MAEHSFCPIAAIMRAAEMSSQAGRPAATGAFNVNFFAQADGVLEGLRRAGAPAIIQASKGANEFQGGPDKISYMVRRAMESSGHTLPIGLHLDHGNVEKGALCVDSGYSGIMIDASEHDFQDNCAVTRVMVVYAHRKGVGVEGEYGQLSGVEEDIARQAGVYADPKMVPVFFQETDADSLAIAYGTSHGPNKGSNNEALKTEIVHESYEALVAAGMQNDHFLVGHGSSTVPQELVEEINRHGGKIEDAQGVPLEKIKEGIAFGLRKMNIDTDLRLGITAVARKFFVENPSAATSKTLAGTKQALDENLDAIDPRKYLKSVEPFEILREPPEDSGSQEFVDLMAFIRDRIAEHVAFLATEFGCAGLAGSVEEVTTADMATRYAQSDSV